MGMSNCTERCFRIPAGFSVFPDEAPCNTLLSRSADDLAFESAGDPAVAVLDSRNELLNPPGS